MSKRLTILVRVWLVLGTIASVNAASTLKLTCTGELADTRNDGVSLGECDLNFIPVKQMNEIEDVCGIPGTVDPPAAKTPVAEAAGARTQLNGVVGAVVVALLLLVAPNLLQHLPTPALAAVVIAAAIGLFEVTDLIRIFRIQQWEFWLSIVCFVGVAVFGAIPGIGLAIAIAVIEFLWDGWRPHSAVLGRWEAPLFFANARQIPGLIPFPSLISIT
jgi:Sulfate permease family